MFNQCVCWENKYFSFRTFCSSLIYLVKIISNLSWHLIFWVKFVDYLVANKRNGETSFAFLGSSFYLLFNNFQCNFIPIDLMTNILVWHSSLFNMLCSRLTWTQYFPKMHSTLFKCRMTLTRSNHFTGPECQLLTAILSVCVQISCLIPFQCWWRSACNWHYFPMGMSQSLCWL